MLHFEKSFASFLFHSERERRIYTEENPPGLFATVQAYPNIVSGLPSHRRLSNSEKEYIEQEIGEQYMNLWGDKAGEIRSTLGAKVWFGFDLDDTLHEFRKSSGVAVSTILQIIGQRYTIPIDELATSYSSVLSRATAGAFTDGKKSSEYRKERFVAVLESFSITPDGQFLDHLAQAYETALEASFEPKCGALSLITHIKSLGKKIVVITEGPQDAQELAVEKLGLSQKIDFLATTNSFRVSKVDGLFGKVLERLQIQASEMVYVGDSAERDMIPAAGQGIYAIHYAEHENISLDVYPVKINTLNKLQYLLPKI